MKPTILPLKTLPNAEMAYLRSSALSTILRALRKFQPEDAVAVLKEAQAAYRTFDEIYADDAAKAAAAKAKREDGNFG